MASCGSWFFSQFAIAVVVVIVVTTTPRNAPGQRKTAVESMPVLNAVLDQAAYENQQRAKRLLQIETEIKTLPDALVRGHLRSKILEFVFSKDVRSEYEAAERLLITMFEDLSRNEKDVGHRKLGWTNSIALLLRKHAPQIAKRFEAKYAKNVDTSPLDEEYLRTGGDPFLIIDRVIAQIGEGVIPAVIHSLYFRFSRSDRHAALRILTALLERGERYADPTPLAYLHRFVENPNPREFEIPVETMARYYRYLVNMARVDKGTQSAGLTFFTTAWPLDQAMPRIKETDAKLYAEATIARDERRKLLSDAQRQKELASDRVAASDDPLEAAIAEADRTKDPDLKDHLWAEAARRAVLKRYYKKAVDLLMNARPNLGLVGQPHARDVRLRGLVVREASAKRDLASAEYAIARIENDLERANAMLFAAGELGRWEPESHAGYAEMIVEAFDTLEKTTIDAPTICWIGNAVNDWIRFTRADSVRALPMRSRAIAIAHRIPAPDPTAKPGSMERSKYVASVLAAGLSCVEWVAWPRPGAYVHAVPIEFIDQVKIREWHLAVKIQAEASRHYPLPQK